MPPAELLFYQEDDGTVPVVTFLEDLKAKDRRAFAKTVARLRLLAQMGSELRRPATDSLRDGIRELRARSGKVHPRILYSFEGQNIVLLEHGMTKVGAVPDKDIDRALQRREKFRSDPEKHTLHADLDDLWE